MDLKIVVEEVVVGFGNSLDGGGGIDFFRLRFREGGIWFLYREKSKGRRLESNNFFIYKVGLWVKGV